jgi:hypothetical protein
MLDKIEYIKKLPKEAGIFWAMAAYQDDIIMCCQNGVWAIGMNLENLRKIYP